MEMIADISSTSDGMCKIVSNLLLISKFESNQIKPFYNIFNVNFLFSELLKYHQSKAETKGIQIILNNEIDIVDIKQDYNLLKECFDNLLSNALKFSPNSTIVEIHSYLEMNGNHSKYLVIEVEDSGPGIKKTEQHLLFKKFAKLSTRPTNNELTTGLGLALTKLIIDLLNGTIEYKSSKAKGANFIIRVPMID